MNAKPSGLAAIVLAAGLGTRMRSARPKVVHEVGGRALVGHVVAALAQLRPERVALVIGPEPAMAEVVEAASDAAPGLALVAVEQRERRGTGHAARETRKALAGFRGTVLVLVGDAPLVTAATLRRLVAAHRRRRAGVTVLGFRPADPTPYGRLVTGARDALEAIVEARDADAATRRIGLCNSGMIAVDAKLLFDLLARLRPANAQRELYLTDIVAIARRRGLACLAVEADGRELIAVNSRAELAGAEAEFQRRARAAAMRGGATLVAPESVFFAHDTSLGRDVVVGPDVVFGPGVAVGDGAEIRAFSHLEGCVVAAGATIGPFARIRPGSLIGEGARVGNFVEVKAALVGRGAKLNHLTYIGDARIGDMANIGAGTITCNYDGFGKYVTEIGARAFIGSDVSLVAPVRVGDGAYVATGSVVTEDVPGDALAVARARQTTKPGWAAKFRARRAAEKAKG